MKFLSRAKRKIFKGKFVLVRVDFNIAIKNGKISEMLRIDSVIPTINYLLRKRVKRVILISHLGRPQKRDKNFSLRPVASYLSKKLKQKITFLESINPEIIKNSPTKLIMLENLRFWQGEEKNDKNFARKLASLGDVYINDAFSVSHRKTASIASVPKLLPSYVGLLFEKEYKNLLKLFKPKYPFVVILGGVKISDKLPLINKFIRQADFILVGGGIANTFLGALGFNVGKSLCGKSEIAFAKKLLAKGKIMVRQAYHNPEQSRGIILPIDFKVVKSLNSKKFLNVASDLIAKNEMILDIGEATAGIFSDIIKDAKTILWNGPLGYFENPVFGRGSKRILKAICRSKAFKVAGGGETVGFIMKNKGEKCFNWVSTAGGAMLEFLAKGILVGIKALENRK